MTHLDEVTAAPPVTPAAEAVLVDAGVAGTPEAVSRVEEYLRRSKRARWFGVVLGLVLGFGPLAGDKDYSLTVARLLAGYLLALLVADLFTPRPHRLAVRAATLRPRSAADLVPRMALVLPWLALTPLLAAPALAIGWHPRGRTQLADARGSCEGNAYWPSTGTLLAIAGVAAVALVVTAVTLRRLSRRPQPAEQPDAMLLDRALRARSARAALAGATALGLTLMALVGQMVDAGIHSWDCSKPLTQFSTTTGNVYSWAPSVNPWLQDVSLAVLLAAIPAWMLCKRLPLPRRGGDSGTAR